MPTRKFARCWGRVGACRLVKEGSRATFKSRGTRRGANADTIPSSWSICVGSLRTTAAGTPDDRQAGRLAAGERTLQGPVCARPPSRRWFLTSRRPRIYLVLLLCVPTNAWRKILGCARARSLRDCLEQQQLQQFSHLVDISSRTRNPSPSVEWIVALLLRRPGVYSKLHGLQNFREGLVSLEEGATMDAIVARIRSSLTGGPSPSGAGAVAPATEVRGGRGRRRSRSVRLCCFAATDRQPFWKPPRLGSSQRCFKTAGPSRTKVAFVFRCAVRSSVQHM